MVRFFSSININKYLCIKFDVLDIQDTASSNNSLFRSCRTLLMVLYRRDSRRSFAPSGHWLIGDLKTSSFFNELKKGRKIYSVGIKWIDFFKLSVLIICVIFRF